MAEFSNFKNDPALYSWCPLWQNLLLILFQTVVIYGVIMLEYLDYSMDWDDAGIASLHDELPLWSAPFGLMLLDQVKLNPGMTVLDIGFGTGFPVIELEQRPGNSSAVYGIDPWTAAAERTQNKIKAFC